MKSLLFTGASGFLGNNILDTLRKTYSVDTLGISQIDNYNINISKDIPVLKKKYDVVLHAAGKAHVVPKNEQEIKQFYDINVQGTMNLCTALENCGVPLSLIFISTVAVYGCETGILISEDHPLDGTSPYADSKKIAEKYLQDWCNRKHVSLTILRPALLAGINPTGNLGSMINGIKKNRYLSVCSGRSKKSMAMASDIAKLIPILENKNGIFNLADSQNPSFSQLENLICKQLNKSKPINIPYWVALVLAKLGDLMGDKAPINSKKLEKITSDLTFSNQKLITELNFIPSDVITNFVI